VAIRPRAITPPVTEPMKIVTRLVDSAIAAARALWRVECSVVMNMTRSAALPFLCIARGEVPVMAGPGDEIAKAARGCGHVRASHAERERVIETLKAAFVQGMLAKDEFDLRVGETFASRTYAELAAVIPDIPVGLTTGGPPPACAQGEARIPRPGVVVAVGTVLYAGTWAFLLPEGIFGALVGIASPLYLIVVIFAGAQLAESGQKERSGGQSPRRPAGGAGGQAFQRPPSADLSRQLPPGNRHNWHTAKEARGRLPCLRLSDRGHSAVTPDLC